MTRQLKFLSQTLAGCSQFLPAPANIALFAVSIWLHLTAAFLENIRAKREALESVQRMRGQALLASELIRHHWNELENDETWCRLVDRFWAVETELEAYASNLDRKGSALWVVWSSFGKVQSNETLHELSRSLKAAALDLQIHLSSINTVKGPHEFIKHPRIRAFWKRRMADALDGTWLQFWQAFLDEFSTLSQLFVGDDGSRRCMAFEAKVKPRNSTNISPRDINKIFQPPEYPVEQIVYALLGLNDSDSLPQQTKIWTVSSSGQILYLNGHWQRHSHKGEVELDLYFANNGKVFGAGRDEIGEHTYRGYRMGNRLILLKQYLQKYAVKYDGHWVTDSRIHGIWTIDNYRSGNFDLETKFTIGIQRTDEQGVSQRYDGFYVYNGYQFEMSVELVFSRKRKIYGNGSDMIGASTWLGIFDVSNGNVELVKQYDLQHAVQYQGMISSIEGETILQGTWKRVGAEGIFQLSTKS